jgi:hypothetical protein
MAVRPSPGPDAHRTFRLGMVASVVAALGCLAVLYRTRLVSPAVVGFALVVLFPVYLLVVASILSVWLGFDRDASNLRRVCRDRDET